MGIYGSTEGLREHESCCRSQIGDQQERKFKLRQKNRAEGATIHMQSVATRYRNARASCQTASDRVQEERRGSRKNFPEAQKVLATSIQMIDSLCKVFETREEAIIQRMRVQAKAWNLNFNPIDGSQQPGDSISATPKSVTGDFKLGTSPKGGGPTVCILCSVQPIS